MPTSKWKINKANDRIVYTSNGKEWRGTHDEAKKIARSLRHLYVDRGPGIFGGRAGDVYVAEQGYEYINQKVSTRPHGFSDPKGLNKPYKYGGKRVKLDYWIVRLVMYL